MLALMLTAFLTCLYRCDWVLIRFTIERGFADDEYHINIQYQQKLICENKFGIRVVPDPI